MVCIYTPLTPQPYIVEKIPQDNHAVSALNKPACVLCIVGVNVLSFAIQIQCAIAHHVELYDIAMHTYMPNELFVSLILRKFLLKTDIDGGA